MSIARVRTLLAEVKEMGAEVELAPSTPDALAQLRTQLGFDLPADYVTFCQELGDITIELVRTWFFYGAHGTLEKTREYATELDAFRGTEGPYYPSRFFVFCDEGDYSNTACGWVWDADLAAFFQTDGGRWVDRADARKIDVWKLLIEELESIRERIADPDDELVSGEADEVNARRRLP